MKDQDQLNLLTKAGKYVLTVGQIYYYITIDVYAGKAISNVRYAVSTSKYLFAIE